MTAKLITGVILTAALMQVACGQESQFVIAFLNTNPSREKLSERAQDSIQNAHMANINRLANEGKLLAAGPFEGGGGIFVLNTKDVREAEAWVQTDPGVHAHRWNLEYVVYTPRVGSICKVEGKLTMVMYRFVRYTPRDTASAQSLARGWDAHSMHVRAIGARDSVIAEGSFAGEKGGLLVVRGPLDEAFVREDPSLRQGIFDARFAELYIARGAFCER